MDIDIDFTTNFDPQHLFPTAIRASQVKDGKLIKHPAGAYLQDIPRDPITGLAAIPYKAAEELGYFKIDFLHLSVVDDFAKHLSKHELRLLCEIEPNWNLLLKSDVVEKLFQIHQYHNLVKRVKPTSVLMLADIIAMIRPHGRRFLEEYIKCKNTTEREAIRALIYTAPADGSYYYKKAHSVGYAMTIVIQLHLIESGLL